jgi:hypothetical protein
MVPDDCRHSRASRDEMPTHFAPGRSEWLQPGSAPPLKILSFDRGVTPWAVFR